VKVLDRNGSGWLSDLIEGLDWCINNKMHIVNMSLGSSSDNQSFHDAITKTYRAGLVQVAAAGNNGLRDGSIDYPAKYPETIAVSAVGQYSDGSLYPAYFSSYGPEIDLTAPGVSIKSTYNDGYYKTLDGTSMAAPHVSGVAALTLAVKGPMTPDDLKTHLKNTAENLGLDTYEQGAGLIRADLATQ
jgi:subtilisin family serine protease